MNFDIFAIIQEYAVMAVAGACYLLGALIKHTTPVDNRWIPLLLLPVGVVGVLWINAWEITPDTIMGGICSTALAVYAHQTGKQTVSIMGEG
ncbi:MAG: phage holin family protein [Clostridia bacterium]|nr:phage holin family protein [Clostridia bacterium]